LSSENIPPHLSIAISFPDLSYKKVLVKGVNNRYHLFNLGTALEHFKSVSKNRLPQNRHPAPHIARVEPLARVEPPGIGAG
jgi:hypothetical protein